MLGGLVSSLGNYVGGYLGGGILSTLGRDAGRMTGNYLEKKWFQRKKFSHKFTNIHDSFHITKAEYGRPIPLVFGKSRILGQIIWADRITEKRNDSSITKYFHSQNTTLNKTNTNLEYFASFAMALCEGEIVEINRTWYHDELIDLSNYKFRLYKGCQAQEPDPLIVEKSDEPAVSYRGLAYIVFEDLPLSDFDNMIPNLSFEVRRKANLENYESVEGLVESMIMIPGSGEYVYDTEIQSKRHKNTPEFMAGETINSHNNQNIADSVYSLNQLQNICENVKWVSPVVCWFGDDLTAEKCQIKPAVEFKDPNTVYSTEWKVGGYDRSNAYEIRKDEQGNPLYGGSVNDQSVLNYLKELKGRQLNVMFYPMFFLDVDQKPWRGRLTGDPEGIRSFFNRRHGYNDFIIHYANLVKDHVDAFVIGSELIGLTKVRDGDVFPAVDELVKLAGRVKQIVGDKVKVSYAADWSEYHHTEGGWFNLDPIWASPDIDFVGIDAYFPATDSISSVVDIQELEKGWCSGEGYDYYIDPKTKEQKELKPEYAWKNLRYWWQQEHLNPDGKKTAWIPKSKPIWFTEFGFPSVDKASNQPNVFFDPKCIDGGVPKYSNGNVDFSVQRKAIAAFIRYWKTQEYIGQMFLWTWDARPYPAWPHMDVWRDGYLWEKGHWVNNKFGNTNLASILLEISDKSGVNIDNLSVSSLDVPIEGVVFNNRVSAINAIDTLRATYFFDINSHQSSNITFVKRGNNAVKIIKEDGCIKVNDHSFIEEVEIPDNMKLSNLDLYYMDGNNDYSMLHKAFNNENNSYAQNAVIHLPISLSEFDIENIGNLILKNAAIEDSLIKFIIPANDINLNPCDFVNLKCDGGSYNIRIIRIKKQHLQQEVTAIIDQRTLYFRDISISNNVNVKHVAKSENWQPDSQLIIDIVSSDSMRDAANIVINYVGAAMLPLYAKLGYDSNWQKLMNIIPVRSLSVVQEFRQPFKANIFIIDESSHIIVKTTEFTEKQNGQWQQILVGKEILSFKRIEKIKDDVYRLSYLIRGQKGTHIYINQHDEMQYLSKVSLGNNLLSISKKMLNQLIDFKCGHQVTKQKVEVPEDHFTIYIIENFVANKKLYLKWVYRVADDSGWLLPEENNISYKIEILGDQRIVKWVRQDNFLIIEGFDISGDYKVNIIPSVIPKYKV